MTLPYPIRKISKILRRNPLNYWYYKEFKSNEKFTFADQQYDYLYHRRNFTWLNERAVEVPIVWDFVERHHGQRILEVGNVLSNYFPIRHDVVDKYERAAGVINEDVIDYSPDEGYDLIVSISTLEHVGWDEKQKDPEKIPLAIENLQRLLKPGGSMVLTMPLGYNPHLDQLLANGGVCFDRQHYLKRISNDNRWQEVEWASIEGTAYNRPFFNANALVVGIQGSDKSL